MSKMWRRIYSSPSARFSYEKVSIGTWYPFPVSRLCRTFGFDFSRQNARRKQQQMPLPQETCHRIYSSPSARWKCVNKHLKSVSGLSVSNFRFWFFSSKSTKKNKQTANCHSLKKPVIEPPSRSLCIETKKIGEIILNLFLEKQLNCKKFCVIKKTLNKEKKILLLLYLLSIITNTYTNDVEIFHLFFILTVMLNMTKKNSYFY